MGAPDAVLIGMKRSGTTFLRSYFESHPDIDWSRQGYGLLQETPPTSEGFSFSKENKIFVDVCEHIGVGQIVKNEKIWEEHRVNPFFKDYNSIMNIDVEVVAQRLKSLFPQTKIVLTLRNQKEWLHTHYKVLMGKMPSKHRTFNDFLHTPEGAVLLNGLNYDRLVQIYYDLFGEENVLILPLEKIRSSREEALMELCQFLEVDYAPMPEKGASYNKSLSVQESKLQLIRRKIKKYPVFYSALKPFSKIITPILRLFIRNDSLLKQNDQEYVSELSKPVNRRLVELTSIDFKAMGYDL